VLRCFICWKADAGKGFLCDCGDGAPGTICDKCRDEVDYCVDCSTPYCRECFHKPEHNLCLPPESDHPEHKLIEKRWCRLCKEGEDS
jgi:hypothetical protein